jgi:hypothetical protein
MKTKQPKKKYCCNTFKQNAVHKCRMHDKFECADTLLVYLKSHGWGISIKDGGTAAVIMNFCPFCGTKIDNQKQTDK